MNQFKNNGSAILTALFIMILVAIAATAMSLRLQIDINRSQLIQDVASLQANAQEGQLIMINKLLNNTLKYKINIKENIDTPHFTKSSTSEDNIIRKTVLTDLQANFNLNNIIDKSQLKSFTLLINNVLPKIKLTQALHLSLFSQEWISKLNPNLNNLTTNKYYQSLAAPYIPSHKPFSSVSEFRLVKGITYKIFNKLHPYITALPEQTAINLNTASKQVLRTLGAGLTNKQADDIIQERGKKGFKTLKEALAKPSIKKLNILNKGLTLTSDYFLIATQVSAHEVHMVLFTIVKRTIKKNKVTVQVLQQTINTL